MYVSGMTMLQFLRLQVLDHALVQVAGIHRMHFLMSGFVRYNLKSSDPDESQHAGVKSGPDDRGLPQGLQLELR